MSGTFDPSTIFGDVPVYYPRGVNTAAQAEAYGKIKVGSKVYMKGTCGDFWKGKSVTIPQGQPGRLVEYFAQAGNPNAPNARWWMARIALTRSPGQPELTVVLPDLNKMWVKRRKPVPPPPPTNRYEHLMADTLGRAFESTSRSSSKSSRRKPKRSTPARKASS